MGPFSNTVMKGGKKERIMCLRNFLSAQAGQALVATEAALWNPPPSYVLCPMGNKELKKKKKKARNGKKIK